jgi:transcriptional regulator with XRE-family HTH domain
MKEKEILAAIGARIKMLRLKRNMTQNDLAIEYDIEKASISRIEAGLINITVRTLYRISKALNISVADLLSY